MALATAPLAGMFGACLAAAGPWDLPRRRIPNSLNLVIALLGLGVAVASRSLVAVGEALAGAGVLFALLYAAYRRRWIGGGDVKLGAAFGAWLGPIGGMYALVIGAALNGI